MEKHNDTKIHTSSNNDSVNSGQESAVDYTNLTCPQRSKLESDYKASIRRWYDIYPDKRNAYEQLLYSMASLKVGLLSRDKMAYDLLCKLNPKDQKEKGIIDQLKIYNGACENCLRWWPGNERSSFCEECHEYLQEKYAGEG